MSPILNVAVVLREPPAPLAPPPLEPPPAPWPLPELAPGSERLLLELDFDSSAGLDSDASGVACAAAGGGAVSPVCGLAAEAPAGGPAAGTTTRIGLRDAESAYPGRVPSTSPMTIPKPRKPSTSSADVFRAGS